MENQVAKQTTSKTGFFSKRWTRILSLAICSGLILCGTASAQPRIQYPEEYKVYRGNSFIPEAIIKKNVFGNIEVYKTDQGIKGLTPEYRIEQPIIRPQYPSYVPKPTPDYGSPERIRDILGHR